jgi:hypothetical protein
LKPRRPHSPVDIADLVERFADAVALRVSTRLTNDLSNAQSAAAKKVEPDFLGERDVARRTGISVRTLQSWRFKGKGPPYTRAGRRVIYPRQSLNEFLGGSGESIRAIRDRSRISQ